jgi:nucleotide-binding universal stress UspA family protein
LMMASGPVVIGFDGTVAAQRAVRVAGELLGPRRALVVVAIEEGVAFGEVMAPVFVSGLPATELEVRTAVRAEQAVIEQAIGVAQKGAALAQEVGLEAESVVVGDEVSAARTVLRVAEEQDASVVVVGGRRRGALSRLFLGSTANEVLKRALRPVLVVRDPDTGAARD